MRWSPAMTTDLRALLRDAGCVAIAILDAMEGGNG